MPTDQARLPRMSSRRCARASNVCLYPLDEWANAVTGGSKIAFTGTMTTSLVRRSTPFWSRGNNESGSASRWRKRSLPWALPRVLHHAVPYLMT